MAWRRPGDKPLSEPMMEDDIKISGSVGNYTVYEVRWPGASQEIEPLCPERNGGHFADIFKIDFVEWKVLYFA